MVESGQFLRVGLSGTSYLLPSSAGFSIEQREHLVPNVDPRHNATAWRVVKSERWPAFYLDADLQLKRDEGWQRAVFLEGHPHPAGLITDELQLLPRADVHVEPFTPLGPPSTPVGHLFSGAWINDNQLILVFDPRCLATYLLNLGKSG